jgi:hypothetical protein
VLEAVLEAVVVERGVEPVLAPVFELVAEPVPPFVVVEAEPVPVPVVEEPPLALVSPFGPKPPVVDVAVLPVAPVGVPVPRPLPVVAPLAAVVDEPKPPLLKAREAP